MNTVRNNFLASLEPLSTRYALGLLDLDGVVYRGGKAVEHAVSAIGHAQQHMQIEYTTNNSSRFQATVAEQLAGFGLNVEPWQVITSSVVAARMLARALPEHANVLVLGAPHLRQEIEHLGLRIVEHCTDNPQGVIQGWYPQMTWQEMAEVAFAVEAGAKYFVTNRDLTIPREHGIAPGCGSMIQAVINATGVEPIASAGKPESAMYDEARSLVAQHTNADQSSEPIAIERSLAIGDRLDTDIEAGTRGGYDSLLVLTGVTDARTLMLAEAHVRPSYVSVDLRGLNDIHQAPIRVDDTTFTCAQARAYVDHQRIVVNDVTSCDALRAASALAWNLADAGVDVRDYELPEFTF